MVNSCNRYGHFVVFIFYSDHSDFVVFGVQQKRVGFDASSSISGELIPELTSTSFRFIVAIEAQLRTVAVVDAAEICSRGISQPYCFQSHHVRRLIEDDFSEAT
jgi:hypothetical protein